MSDTPNGGALPSQFSEKARPPRLLAFCSAHLEIHLSGCRRHIPTIYLSSPGFSGLLINNGVMGVGRAAGRRRGPIVRRIGSSYSRGFNKAERHLSLCKFTPSHNDHQFPSFTPPRPCHQFYLLLALLVCVIESTSCDE